jgi:hypothetical protein
MNVLYFRDKDHNVYRFTREAGVPAYFYLTPTGRLSQRSSGNRRFKAIKDVYGGPGNRDEQGRPVSIRVYQELVR